MERQGNAPCDDQPVVLAAEGPHGPVVHAANRTAQLAGVRHGARVVDMRALCPALRVDYADIGGDRAALAKLSLWARRWCPWTAADGADGIVLDTTGSDHLRGGEAALLAEIEGRLATLGFTARVALAPTWGAAWGLARYGAERAISRDTADLAPLPATALRLDGDTVLLLDRLGLKTVGALAAVPRLSLMRRFARAEPRANPLLRLDQALGRTAEPVSSPEAPAVFRAEARLADPAFEVRPWLPMLCEELCRSLAGAGQGVRRFALTVWRTDGEVRRIALATATPSREPGHLLGLFGEKPDALDPGFGFDLIAIEATVTEPLAAVQDGLARRAADELALPRLIDRLTARFGPRAVSRPVRRASHLPERAVAAAAPLAAAGELPPRPRRPLRLLDPAEEVRVLYSVPEGPPAQFVWRRQTRRVARYEGPERIAPEWWHDKPGTRLRDYFAVEDETGCRYWLYREGLNEDGRGGAPRWFLHGIFA